MEFESTLQVVSRSFDDIQKVYNILNKKYKGISAWVWRSVPSFDEMDKSFVQMEIDRIPYWAPTDSECGETMVQIAKILGNDGFAFLEIRNSVSPDYSDYIVTTPYGGCKAAYDQGDSGRSAMLSLENSYSDDLISIFRKSKDGYKELWNKDRQAEPPMPYKRETKPVRTHEQVVQDDYLYRKSDESVEAYRNLLTDPRDLNGIYEQFREMFEKLAGNREQMDAEYPYILTNKEYYKNGPLFEKISLGTRLESTNGFSFFGKIFHIHGSGIVQFKSVNIDPQIIKLLSENEEALRVAIARRGGIIDDYDYSKRKLRYIDCCVMLDNEDQRYWDWDNKFSESISGFGMELISRLAIWYAIVHTPELSPEEIQSLQDGKLYLQTIEIKNNKVLEAEERLKEEAEERARQYKAQRAKDFEDIMKLLREKYSEEKASSYAQIEKEVNLDSFSSLSYWNAVKNHISETYGVTPAAYFKNEGIIGKKGEPAKKTELEKKPTPAKKAESEPKEPAKKPVKKSKENPLIAIMRQAVGAYGLELEDVVPEDDIVWHLDELPDPEPDELDLELIGYVEDEVRELKEKYAGKPKFASYAELKKETPEGDWKWDEDVIKKYIHSTPAAYYKEAGLIRSGPEKEQLIEGPAQAKKASKKTKTDASAPTEKEAKSKAPKVEPKSEPAQKKPEEKPKSTRKTSPEITIDGDKIIATVVPNAKGEIAIKKYAGYSKATEIVVPEGVTKIDQGAFEGATMESVVLPESLKSIDMHAFRNCKKLKNIELPERIEIIEMYAFDGCDALEEIHLPDSLQKVQYYAFAPSNGRKGPVIHMSGELARRLHGDRSPWLVIASREFVIDGEPWANIREYYKDYKKSLKPVKKTDESGPAGMDAAVEPKAPSTEKEHAAAKPTAKESAKKEKPKQSPVSLEMTNGVLKVNMAGETVIKDGQFLYDQNQAPLVIPEGVTAIGNGSFRSTAITAVSLPRSLKTIGPYAFADNKALMSVELQEGLEEIDLMAFNNCPNLKTIRLPSSIRHVESSAFTSDAIGNESRMTVYVPESTVAGLVSTNKYPPLPTCIAAGFMIGGERYPSLENYLETGEERKRQRAEQERQEQIRREQEAGKQRRRDELHRQIAELEKERDSLKGLFAGLKRNKIQKQIDELKEQIRRI